MIARCPSNDEHHRFITPAHIMEDWLVDEHGEFIDVLERLETTHEPDYLNSWECADCGELAIVDPWEN